MRQVLVNLFDNALELSERPVTATVGRAGSAGVRLVVRDHGPGLPDGDAAKIFEPFFTTTATRGTGLGPGGVQAPGRGTAARSRPRHPDGGGAAFTILLPKAVR
jgi:two-component system OmpR family sensor kinase